MTALPIRSDLIGPDVAGGWLWLLAILGIVGWFFIYRVGERLQASRLARRLWFPVMVVVGAIVLWLFWQAMGRVFSLESSWRLWTNAWIGSLAITALLGLYRLERQLILPRWGRWLLGLRLLAAGAVLTMLAQPVFTRDETRRIDRNVVVMVDDSASMQVADAQMPSSEVLAAAAFAGATIPETPPDLRRAVRQSSAWREASGLQAEGAAAAAISCVEELRKALERLPNGMGGERDRLLKLVVGEFGSAAARWQAGLKNGEPEGVRRAVQDCNRLWAEIEPEAMRLADVADAQFVEKLPESSKSVLRQVAGYSRARLAEEVLTRPRDQGTSFLQKVSAKYTLRTMRFGRGAAEADLATAAVGDENERRRTDLTGALAKVLELYPPDALAGVVVVSDFRHNGSKPPDDMARALGLQGSPLGAVVVGSEQGIRDAAIVSLGHAQSVFLGDRVRFKAEVKVDGMKGKELRLKLFKAGDVVVQEVVVPVTEERFRTTVSLSDLPSEKGILSYRVQLAPVEGERTAENNEWKADVAISDDRTNVLLLDGTPRWEFRYLRNLFDSRDKSVHLQYVLQHPDRLEGVAALPAVAASVSRPFGESEATRLPASPEEWRKFDVIIIGDVEAGWLREEEWKTIGECVEERGAMLCFIAGPSSMPRGLIGTAAERLMPVMVATEERAASREDFQVVLTAAGKGSSIFVQADSALQSQQVWDELPALTWRQRISGIKPGAEVLAWAESVNYDASGKAMATSPVGGMTGDPATALQRRRECERERAIFVTSQVGLGKVAMLLSDQTWRLRYGVGDTHHHKFWGQMMRWGAGENLAVGNDAVRLGTDALIYEPGQKMRIMARLMDEKSRPLAGAEVGAEIIDGEKVVARIPLDYQSDSHGMYVAEADAMTTPGAYRVRLVGDEVDRLLKASNTDGVEQKLTVVAEINPIEMGEVASDPSLAARVASLSGGRVTAAGDAASLLDLFGAPTTEVPSRRETRLWDHWLLLLVAIAAVTAEWILRRRAGVA
jgi:hypothetical protein